MNRRKIDLSIILLLMFLLGSCVSHKAKDKDFLHFSDMSLIADIYGDDHNDTVVVRKHDVYSNRKVLYLLLNNRYKKICEVISREDDVERLYIESNHINAGDKGIRLIVRNTEMRPAPQSL